MTTSRILSVLLILSLLFTCMSCANNDDDYVDKVPESTEYEEGTFVYSASSKTLHRPTCPHAMSISEFNKLSTQKDPLELIEHKFKFCGACCPVESELYNPKDEELGDSGVDPALATYVLNTNSRRIHKPECQYAIDMKPENRYYTDLPLAEIMMQGYAACQICQPE